MDEIAETQAALRETMENEKRRVANAGQLREFLGKQLAAGIVPDHYRIEWLQKSVFAVIATLGGAAAAFDRAHPQDKATARDLLDILISTQAKILARLQEQGE